MFIYLVLCSGDELSQVAYITFKDKQGAETAMLLTVYLLSHLKVLEDSNYFSWIDDSLSVLSWKYGIHMFSYLMC
jgi:hypothetical protein